MIKNSPSKSKAIIDGYECILGRGSEVTYTLNGKPVLGDKVPPRIKQALVEKALKCKAQRVIIAGPGAREEAKTTKKLSPKKTAAEYTCTGDKGSNKYTHLGVPVPVTAIPDEVKNLITCKLAAKAYYDPGSIGKTRSETQFICSGGLLGKRTIVSAEKVAAEEAKGRKCSPK